MQYFHRIFSQCEPYNRHNPHLNAHSRTLDIDLFNIGTVQCDLSYRKQELGILAANSRISKLAILYGI